MSVDFIRRVLGKYNVRPTAIEDILAHVDVDLRNQDSVTGGGTVLPLADKRYILVLYSGQEEACLHECAHVWWFLHQNDKLVEQLVGEMLYQAETNGPRFRKVRGLCKLYRDGDGRGWPGMWVGPPYDRWNADEIFAGLASATMGDTKEYPPELRVIYEMLFNPRELTYLPIVFG